MNTALGYLGSIPDGWKLVHLGRLTSEVRTLNSDCSEMNALQFKMGSIISKSTGDSKYHPESLEGYTVVVPGDVVVNGLNLNYDLKSLRVGQVRENGVITSAYIVIRPEKIDASYFKYLLKGFDSIKTFHGMGKGIRLTLSYEELRRMYIPVPSPSEQTRIASFLDDRCAKIDEAIARHDALIKKLDDYRKAVITEAVTKGISGKKNWASKAIKHSFRIVPGATPASGNPEYWDGDIIWITPSDYKTRDHYVSAGAKTITKDGYDSCSTRLVPAGSLIFSKRAPIGTVAISKTALCTNQGCLSCVPKKDTNVEFFYYAFFAYLEVFDVLGSGTTFKEISTSAFSNVKIETPSLEEQQEIVAYLDKKCAAIDATKERHAQLMAKLDEYKKSLIYYAVTGKIEC